MDLLTACFPFSPSAYQEAELSEGWLNGLYDGGVAFLLYFLWYLMYLCKVPYRLRNWSVQTAVQS